MQFELARTVDDGVGSVATVPDGAETDTAGGLRVELVKSQADIPTDLWDACFPPPLEGRWWYQTLEESGLEDQFSFSYAVVRQGARPVGIVPLFRSSLPLDVVVPDPLLPIGRVIERAAPDLIRPPTLFIGSPCSDEGAIGLLPDVDRRAALLALQDWLVWHARQIRARVLIWKDLTAAWSADFNWLMERRRLFKSISYPGSVVTLPGSSKEQYLTGLTSARRQKFKRALKRGGELMPVRVEALQNPDAATLDRMFALFEQTYQHATTKFERLNRNFFANIAKHPVSHFVILREVKSGEIVAFVLCFLMGPHVINKFIGIDRAQPSGAFLFLRLWDAMLDWSLAQGATSIQSGQTGYSGKMQTGHQLVPLNNYCHVHNRGFHALFRFVGQRLTWQGLDKDLATVITASPEMAAAQYV